MHTNPKFRRSLRRLTSKLINLWSVTKYTVNRTVFVDLTTQYCVSTWRWDESEEDFIFCGDRSL